MISIPSHLNVSSQDGGGPLLRVLRYLTSAPRSIFIRKWARAAITRVRDFAARCLGREGQWAELEFERNSLPLVSPRIKGFAEPMRGFCVGFSGVGGGLSCVAVHGQQHAEKDSGNARFSVGEIRNVQR